MKKEEILNKLKEIKPIYEKEGLEILGIFGSYAKDTQTEYSDIDIAYKLNYKKFSEKYQVKTIKELIDFYNKIVEHQEEFINLI